MGRGKRREVAPSRRPPRASIFLSPQPPHDAKRPFPGSKNSHFQNEAKSKTFLVKINFLFFAPE